MRERRASPAPGGAQGGTTEWNIMAAADFAGGATNTTIGLLGLVLLLALFLLRLATSKEGKAGLADKMV